jgi:hypothetical protein
MAVVLIALGAALWLAVGAFAWALCSIAGRADRLLEAELEDRDVEFPPAA